MKKVLSLVVCFFMVFSFCGCSQNSQNKSGLKIAVSCFPAYDFTRSIVGNSADITLLLKPGSEAHDFEPTPADIIKIKSCDLFVCVGGEDEVWVDTLLKNELKDSAVIIKMLEVCQKSGDDEHIWTSPKNALTITEKIYEALISIDSKNAEQYLGNFEKAKSVLQALDKTFSDIVSKSQLKSIVFADRFPFYYLAKEYSFDYVSAFDGCSSHTEPDAKAVANIILYVKENNIPCVFYTEFSNQKMADTICEETNTEKLLLHSCHNVTKAEFENGETYYSLMTKNAENLKIALKSS